MEVPMGIIQESGKELNVVKMEVIIDDLQLDTLILDVKKRTER